VLGRGFEPEEPLSMILTAETETAAGRQGVRHEIQPAQNVRPDPDGTFIIDADLQPLAARVTWHVAVIHRRGVACAAFFAP
jgi:hypothetical protein